MIMMMMDNYQNICLGPLKEQCMANNLHPESPQNIWELRRKI